MKSAGDASFRRRGLLEAGAIFSVVLAGALVGHARSGVALRLVALAVTLAIVLALEAWGPGRGRSTEDAARRTAAWAFAAGTAMLVSLPPGHVALDFHPGDPLTSVLGAIGLVVSAWLALGEVAR